MRNIQVVELICDLLEELRPQKNAGIEYYRNLIKFVIDRPGHDFRYGVDTSKIRRELGWVPKENFKTGLRKTVEWYINNKVWLQNILNKKNQQNKFDE
jgi:dTDP-glucose 4,6-dehydratase